MSAELVFAVSFFIFLNTCTVITCLPEGKRLWGIHVIIAFVVNIFAKIFPPQEDGQTASQQKLIVSEASQPAVRIICRTVSDAEDVGMSNAFANCGMGTDDGRDRT